MEAIVMGPNNGPGRINQEYLLPAITFEIE